MLDWKTEIRNVLSSLRLKPTREAEIVNELAEHLQNRYEELLASGLSPSTVGMKALRDRITRLQDYKWDGTSFAYGAESWLRVKFSHLVIL